jgi:hypothetical protein
MIGILSWYFFLKLFGLKVFFVSSRAEERFDKIKLETSFKILYLNQSNNIVKRSFRLDR